MLQKIATHSAGFRGYALREDERLQSRSSAANDVPKVDPVVPGT